MRLFLILLGLAIGGFATFCYVYLIGFGCGMGPTGCNSDLIQLYFRHIFNPEGWIYLTVMAVAAVILIAGLRHRS